MLCLQYLPQLFVSHPGFRYSNNAVHTWRSINGAFLTPSKDVGMERPEDHTIKKTLCSPMSMPTNYHASFRSIHDSISGAVALQLSWMCLGNVDVENGIITVATRNFVMGLHILCLHACASLDARWMVTWAQGGMAWLHWLAAGRTMQLPHARPSRSMPYHMMPYHFTSSNTSARLARVPVPCWHGPCHHMQSQTWSLVPCSVDWKKQATCVVER